jgi:hypothetical protein
LPTCCRGWGGPFIGLFQQNGADQAGDGALVGKDADDIGAALDLAVEALDGVGAVDLGAVLAREVHVGEHVMFGGVHQFGQLRHFRAELVGDAAPLGVGGGRIGFGESGPYPAETRRRWVLPACAVALRMKWRRQLLPGCRQDLGHGGLQPFMGIRRRAASLLLTQHPEDLLLREPAPPHALASSFRRTLPKNGGIPVAQVT